MSLIQMSVQGAVMITVILIVRALALNRLPKTTFRVLWWIVLARLLIPYSLPCGLSVYSMLAPQQAPETTVTGIAPIVYDIGFANAANTASPEPVLSETSPFIDLRTAVWIVGMLAAGCYFAVSYMIWRKRFAESLPVENDFLRSWLEDHRTLRPLSIRVYDRISSPLTYGLFRPVILMPKETDWNDTNTLKYVLTHEYVHIRRFDAVFKLLLTISLCVHWFDPMVWVMYIIANRDIELSCDEKVVRILGGGRSSYAMALIQMEEQKIGSYPFSSSFSRNALKERITAIMKFTKITPIAAIAATFLVVGTTVAFATNTAPDTANYNLLNAGTALGDKTISSDKTISTNASAAYEKLIAYKTEDYGQQSIADFHSTLASTPDELTEFLAAVADVISTISPNDENCDFFTTTISFSSQELYCEHMGEEFTFNMPISTKSRPCNYLDEDGETVYDFYCFVEANVAYSINAPKLVTVAERDRALLTFKEEMQNYLNGLSEAKIAGDNIQEMLLDKSAEIANSLSNENMRLSPCEIYVLDIIGEAE